MLNRAGLAPPRSKHIGSIAIHHPAILGSRAAKHRYAAPRTRKILELDKQLGKASQRAAAGGQDANDAEKSIKYL
jgi:hypothetical protein